MSRRLINNSRYLERRYSSRRSSGCAGRRFLRPSQIPTSLSGSLLHRCHLPGLRSCHSHAVSRTVCCTRPQAISCLVLIQATDSLLVSVSEPFLCSCPCINPKWPLNGSEGRSFAHTNYQSPSDYFRLQSSISSPRKSITRRPTESPLASNSFLLLFSLPACSFCLRLLDFSSRWDKKKPPVSHSAAYADLTLRTLLLSKNSTK